MKQREKRIQNELLFLANEANETSESPIEARTECRFSCSFKILNKDFY